MALTASIANEASSALELTPSMPAFALFDASDIIVGVSAAATNWRTRH
jgi:molybdopterin-binding protein